MLRRSLATLVLAISLWIGTLAWSGFLALHTVLDADRSRDVAESLYEDESVREQLALNIAAAVGASIPNGAPVEQAQIDAASKAALDSPAVETLIVDAFVQTHQAFLGEGEAPDNLDAGAFGAAARASLVAQQPQLDSILPASPRLQVPLPTDRIPNAGPLRDFLQKAVPLLALVAAAGATFALVFTSDRPAVIRRTGFWAIGLSTFVLLFAFGVPWAAERVFPDQQEVIAALVSALAASTTGPALALAGAGLAGIVIAFVWKRKPDGVSDAPSIAPASIPTEPPRVPAPKRARRGSRSVTRAMPTGPSATSRPAAPPTAAPPPWVEGQGYLDDPPPGQ